MLDVALLELSAKFRDQVSEVVNAESDLDHCRLIILILFNVQVELSEGELQHNRIFGLGSFDFLVVQ